MQTSEAFELAFSISTRIIDLPVTKDVEGYEDFLSRKQRHTIMSRSSHFVKAGTVDHIRRPNTDEVSGIKSNFSFCPLPQTAQVQQQRHNNMHITHHTKKLKM